MADGGRGESSSRIGERILFNEHYVFMQIKCCMQMISADDHDDDDDEKGRNLVAEERAKLMARDCIPERRGKETGGGKKGKKKKIERE